MISWGRGNRKHAKLLGAEVVSFSIPAATSASGFETCPSRGICAGYCYARRGFFKFPWVAASHEKNLEIVRGNLRTFERRAIADLASHERRLHEHHTLWMRRCDRLPFFMQRGRPPVEEPPARIVVRVHDAGDFFSQPYLDAWYAVARALPTITFYSYTKQFAVLDVWSSRPSNFQLVQSFGGKHDALLDVDRPHSRVFVSDADRIRAGYVDGSTNDGPAIRGERRIGLVFHSDNKPLTAGQRNALAVLS